MLRPPLGVRRLGDAGLAQDLGNGDLTEESPSQGLLVGPRKSMIKAHTIDGLNELFLERREVENAQTRQSP